MYEIRPLPTLAPSAQTGRDMMYGLVDMLDNFILTLKSVPVVPNSSGLFDPSTGEWLQPAVSVFDVLAALLLIAVTIFVFLRFSSIGHGSVPGLMTKTGINK